MMLNNRSGIETKKLGQSNIQDYGSKVNMKQLKF
jgi:hypothetical protein